MLDGSGVAPKKDCENCLGLGFTYTEYRTGYKYKFAKTCSCKIKK